jgi:hypothetical protein
MGQEVFVYKTHCRRSAAFEDAAKEVFSAPVEFFRSALALAIEGFIPPS